MLALSAKNKNKQQLHLSIPILVIESVEKHGNVLTHITVHPAAGTQNAKRVFEFGTYSSEVKNLNQKSSKLVNHISVICRTLERVF